MVEEKYCDGRSFLLSLKLSHPMDDEKVCQSKQSLQKKPNIPQDIRLTYLLRECVLDEF